MLTSLLRGRVTELDNWILLGVVTSLAFLLVIKSWANATAISLAIICGVQIIRKRDFFFKTSSARISVVSLVFMVPLLSEMIVQLARGEMNLSALDGPSRGLLAIPLFVYLARSNPERVASATGIGSFFGIIVLLLSLIIFPEQWWGPRAATYFVDPITLPCFAAALLGLFLFVGLPRVGVRENYLMKIFAVSAVTYIAVQSYSRSSWVALVVLLFAYLTYTQRNSWPRLIFGAFLLCFYFLSIYSLSDTVKNRTNLAVSSLMTYQMQSAGNVNNLRSDSELDYVLRKTSTGHRLMLLRLDFELISRYPLLGVSDERIPSFDELSRTVPLLTKQIYDIKTLAGSHSEFTNQLVTKGVVLGSLSLWALFVYPIWVIWSTSRHSQQSRGIRSQGLFGFWLPIFCSALTIQVFNLKMTMTIYCMVTAIFLACIVANEGDGNERPSN